jgi:hypothetical protein
VLKMVFVLLRLKKYEQQQQQRRRFRRFSFKERVRTIGVGRAW